MFELPVQAKDHRKAMILKCGGGTDNKAASHLVEETEHETARDDRADGLPFLRRASSLLPIGLATKDTNVEADELTNGVFESFSFEKRLEVSWPNCEVSDDRAADVGLRILLKEKVRQEGCWCTGSRIEVFENGLGLSGSFQWGWLCSPLTVRSSALVDLLRSFCAVSAFTHILLRL